MGGKIRDRREELGMTQRELGAKVGTSKEYISQIENGKPKLPNAGLRRALAEALGLQHVELLVAAGELREDEIPKEGEPRRHIVVSKLEHAARECLANDLAGISELGDALERASAASGGAAVRDERQALEHKRALAERRYERVREGWLASDHGPEWLAQETEQFRCALAAIETELAQLPSPPDPEFYAAIASMLHSAASAVATFDGDALRPLVQQIGHIHVCGDGVSIRYGPMYRDFVPTPHLQPVPR